jgi:hypothetical protein
MSKLTKEQEVLILKYNDEKGMLVNKKENRRFQVFYYSMFFLAYAFCLYFLEASSTHLLIMLFVSAAMFSEKLSENLIRKSTRQSRYQGFAVEYAARDWLYKKMLNLDTNESKIYDNTFFKILPISSTVWFMIKFCICLVIHTLISRFLSYELFIYSVIPLFLASIYAWIDGGYRDAWSLSDSSSRLVIKNFFYLTRVSNKVSAEQKKWLNSIYSETKIDEIISDMKRDPEINWVFAKTYK